MKVTELECLALPALNRNVPVHVKGVRHASPSLGWGRPAVNGDVSMGTLGPLAQDFVVQRVQNLCP